MATSPCSFVVFISIPLAFSQDKEREAEHLRTLFHLSGYRTCVRDAGIKGNWEFYIPSASFFGVTVALMLLQAASTTSTIANSAIEDFILARVSNCRCMCSHVQ